MRKVIAVLVLVLASASFGLISPELEQHLVDARPDQHLMVHVVLREQFDVGLLNSLVDGMPKPERRIAVAQILQEYSVEKQAGLLDYLQAAEAQGGVSNITPLWIANAVYCEAKPEVIRAVGERAEVSYVDYDLHYSPGLPEEPGREGPDEITWGVQKINAPAVWALGYTGQGVVCGHIDSGCNYNHPDLADHMWTDVNYPNHGWNFENNNNNPEDARGHGTHTAGTVASDGTSGAQCGVAPDARMMICRVRGGADSVSQAQCWQAMQFCVAPPLSPANGADLYTMSMGWITTALNKAIWRTTSNNVNAAGLTQVVSTGNDSTAAPPYGRTPANVPPPWWNPQNTGAGALSGVMSIGATDVNDNIASFSSRGPVTWQNVPPFNDYAYPPGLTRPDMSAPGVDVKSCSRTGGYTTMSGTSMAAPHVAGTVCLMLSKNRGATPREIDSLLEITALDRGASGKDNDYGAGRVRADLAVERVPLPRPDNQVKNWWSSVYEGDNIYNTNGTDQWVWCFSDRGPSQPAVFHIKVENDGKLADRFVLNATETYAPGTWTIRYYDALQGGAEITDAIRSPAGWLTPALAPGANREIRVEVTPVSVPPPYETRKRVSILTASRSKPDKQDLVYMEVEAKRSQPDNQIKNSSETQYTGDNIYNTSGLNQAVSQKVKAGDSAIYHIKIQNDGEMADFFYIQGTGGDGQWQVKYYSALSGGGDITSQVVQGSYWRYVLQGGAIEIRLVVKPMPGDTAKEVLVTSFGGYNYYKRDAVKATTEKQIDTVIPPPVVED